ncbi:MAG: PAS domain S-box protein, partial [Desulfobacterales bacterium]|nr:PAS domain S-box protein [Desulfobacterales bacterium]
MNDNCSKILPINEPETRHEGHTEGSVQHPTDFSQDSVHQNSSGKAARNEIKRLCAIFQQSKIIKLIVDPATDNIIDANQAASNFFGRSAASLKTQRLNDIINLPPIKRQQNFILPKIIKGIALPFQYRLPLGKIIDLELFIDPVLIQGKPWLYHIVIHDISERKRITGYLQRARERVQDIFQNAHVGIYQIAKDGRFIFANPTTAAMFGYDSPQDLITNVKTVAQHYADPRERKDIVTMLTHSLNSKEFELRLKRKDGTVFWALCDSRIVRDKIGNPIHFEGFMTDISAQKQAETTLKKTEQKLNDIFKNAHIGIYQIYPEGLFKFANPATAKMFGYESPEELIENVNHVEKLYANPKQRQEILEQIDQQPEGNLIQTQFKRKDGSLFWVAFDSRIVRDPTGAILYYEGFMSDISKNKAIEAALRKTERKVQNIFDNTPVGIYQITPEGKVLFANPAAAIMFGYESPDELVLDMDNIEPLYVNPNCRKIIVDNLNQYGVNNTAEIEFRRKDGTTFWCSHRSRIVRDEKGQFIHYEVFLSDITQRRKAEEALHYAIEKKELYRQNLETTFRSIPNEIISVDKDLRVIAKNNAFNDSYCIFSTIRPGDSLQQIFRHTPCPCVEHLFKTIKTRIPLRNHQIECVHGGNPTQIKEINCSLLLDEGNHEAGGALLVMTNITRLTTLEKTLNDRNSFRNIIGRSSVMQNIYRLLELLADLNTTVLITGESGTGKELIADALHYGGDKRSKPIVRVNCGALPDNLLESELFGHVRGAFTGAVKDKIGRFQAAEGGTIFLDEIGDISPLLQLKLLRVLEHKEYE